MPKLYLYKNPLNKQISIASASLGEPDSWYNQLMADFKVGTDQGNGCSPSLYYRAPKDAVLELDNEESLALWGKSLNLSRAELLAAAKVYGCVIRNIRRGLVEEKNKSAA